MLCICPLRFIYPQVHYGPRIENPRVDSSILSPATNKYKGLVFTKPFFICERDKNVTIRTRYRQFKSQSYLLHLQDAQLQT